MVLEGLVLVLLVLPHLQIQREDAFSFLSFVDEAPESCQFYLFCECGGCVFSALRVLWTRRVAAISFTFSQKSPGRAFSLQCFDNGTYASIICESSEVKLVYRKYRCVLRFVTDFPTIPGVTEI